MPLTGTWEEASAPKRLQASSSDCSPRSQDAGSCRVKRLCIRDQELPQAQDEAVSGPTRDLVVEYWERTDECLERKWAHMEMVDRLFASREELILATTLSNEETVLEPNMFPYDTPEGVEHWTLWSRHEMEHSEIEKYVDSWLRENAPQVESWNYDENPSRSINVFHVHVYLKGPEHPR